MVTQAQIEAAAKAICQTRRGEICQRIAWNMDSDSDCHICDFAMLNSLQAKAALTAAADDWGKNTHRLLGEMIEEIKVLQQTKSAGEPNYKTWEQADREDRNATIERCAQVAENHLLSHSGHQIAAAIRALKEKP